MRSRALFILCFLPALLSCSGESSSGPSGGTSLDQLPLGPPLGDPSLVIAYTTAEDSNRAMMSGGNIIALPPKCWITLATAEGRVRPMPSVCAYSLSWAPDGKHIAYQAPDGIWTVRADGTDARHVDGTLAGVVGFTGPIWSRDASRLVAYDFTTLELAVVGLDGTGIRHLASTYRQELSCGNWSPDGRTLLYAPRTPNKSMSGFYTIPVDGSSAPKQLIRDAAHTFTSGAVWANTR